MRNLYANFRDKFKDLELKKLSWKVATSYTKNEFNEVMENIKKENLESFQYLDKIDKSAWTISHFSIDVKCNLLCNNICEEFSKFILEAKEKPIITTMEMIKRLIMKRL